MNSFYRSLLLATVSSVVVQAAPEPTLNAGSEVPLAPLAEAKWIQGEPLKEFEPDKVYIFECWATWCGPCIAAIPHLNELHKKFSEKGLRVYGINVLEDDVEKVTQFVSGKGDGMSYPVAFTGRGSEFETQWMNAAGVSGIPHAFVVRNGKLVTSAHPSMLTDKIINALLSGDESADKAAAEMNEVRNKRMKVSGYLQAFRKAAGINDIEGMEESLRQLREFDAKSHYIEALDFELKMAQKDWPAVIKRLEEGKEAPEYRVTVTMTANRLGMREGGEYPKEFLQALAKAYAPLVEGKESAANPMGLITLATIHWKAEDKAAAVEAAKRAVAVVREPSKTGSKQMSSSPFEKFVASLEADQLPSNQEFFGWLRENQGGVPAGRLVRPKSALESPAAPPEAPKGN